MGRKMSNIDQSTEFLSQDWWSQENLAMVLASSRDRIANNLKNKDRKGEKHNKTTRKRKLRGGGYCANFGEK
jgi:dsDNA-binding SOS-regulon protein